MKKLLPQTLTARLIAIFVLILLASQALNLYLLVDEGRIAGRNNHVEQLMTQFVEQAGDIGSVDRREFPKILSNGRDGSGTVFLSTVPRAGAAKTERMARHEKALRRRLDDARIAVSKLLITRRVTIPGARQQGQFKSRRQQDLQGKPLGLDRAEPAPAGPRAQPKPMMGPPGGPGVGPVTGPGSRRPRPMMAFPVGSANVTLEAIVISGEVQPGVWLNVMAPHFVVETVTLRAALITGVSLLIAIAAVLFLSRWIMRPIRNLTLSAERFGRGIDVDALEETGPIDIQAAARAFNQMQNRVSRLLDTQRTMLRAVGHDLRTPITSLRIRAEDLPEGESRAKIIATLNEMTVMTEEILSWAKDASSSEGLATVDIVSKLASIADDYADQGHEVGFEDTSDTVLICCRRVALRRALRNLIDNALKYGQSAHLSLENLTDKVLIHIDDEGPGIPADQLGDVLRPFVRLEASRSKDTGGIGLGLSITQTIVEAHGGTLLLENRSGGGLRATLSLPKSL